MANHAATATEGYFRTLFAAGTAAGLTDAQLLERVATASAAARAAEAAFEALVARHGPMILGVCRRALDDPRDIEDAFQATFLVLVRKAGTVHVDDSLGRWLYGVARRVATRARQNAHRRSARESDHAADEPVIPSPDAERAELLAALDDELSRLPEKYRAPLVLCYLEGLTHPEAARQLRWPLGTVKGRLAEARNLLRMRLTRRGLAPSVALLGAAIEAEARPAVPHALAVATKRASLRLTLGGPAATAAASASVLTLTRETIKSMTMCKLTKAAVGIPVLLFATAAGMIAQANFGDDARPVDRPGESRRVQEDGRAVPVFCEVKTATEILSLLARAGQDVRRGDVICTLDPRGPARERERQKLTVDAATADRQNARLTREVAEQALTEYLERYKLELQERNAELVLCELERKRAEDRLEWSNRMREKGYLSTAQNIADQVSLQTKVFAYEQATTKRDVLVKFTRDKTVKELQSAIDRARSDEVVRKRRLELERETLTSLEKQIESCRITAPVSGRLEFAHWRPPGSDGGFTRVAVGQSVCWQQLMFWIFPAKPGADDPK